MDFFPSQGLQGSNRTSGAFEVRGRSHSPDCPPWLSKWMCKVQMIHSHVRTEHRHPQTNELLNVTDTLSFCNHHGFPDEMVLEIAQEVYEEKQYLLYGDSLATGARGEEWPDLVNFIQHQTSVPGVEQMFENSVGGLTGSCNRCNIPGLLKLSQHYSSVHEQKFQSETTEETPDQCMEVESVAPSYSPEYSNEKNEKSTFLQYLDRISFRSNTNYSIDRWYHSSVSDVSSPEENA